VSRCHDRGAPYASERPVSAFRVTVGTSVPAWFADGRDGTVLTVHNPTSAAVDVRIRCYPSGAAVSKWDVCLGPHQEKMRVVEFPNIDALRGGVCRVENANATTPRNCVDEE